MFLQLFFCLITISAERIQIVNAQLPLADVIFGMDATITNPAECKCQKNTFIYMGNYALKQPINARFGLIAYADAPVLLYRLTWPLNLTHWNQAVNSMTCTGGSARLDRILALGKQMYMKAGRPGAVKTFGLMVSKLPTVSYNTALNDLIALGVITYAGAITSEGLTLLDLVALAIKNPVLPFSSYCALFTAVKTLYPL